MRITTLAVLTYQLIGGHHDGKLRNKDPPNLVVGHACLNSENRYKNLFSGLGEEGRKNRRGQAVSRRMWQ